MKVRDQELDVHDDQDQVILRLEKENRIKSSPRSPKKPKICVADSPVKIGNKNGEHIKLSVKSSPVLRPRAVLSSPDNDDMIGSINMSSNERSLASKKPKSEQKTPSQARVCTTPFQAKLKGSNEESPNKLSQKGRSLALKNCDLGQKPPKVESPLSACKVNKEAHTKKQKTLAKVGVRSGDC